MTASVAGKSVSIHRLSKRFGLHPAVDRVSIDIPAGSFCSLLGPSGSGKTTLLKMIAGYEEPNEGRIEIDGRDIARTRVADRNIGMVFQNYALFPHMDIAANLSFPLEMRALPRAEITRRVGAMLEMVGLGTLGSRYPRELSGGQQQRVALARALIFSPDILLMDEPLGALDKNLRQTMQQEIKRIHRQVGVTVIYVTHDQEEAINMSDQVVVMKDGRVIQTGAPLVVYNRPETTFVARFLGECNLIEAAYEPASSEMVLKIGDGLRLACASATVGAGTFVGIRPERLRLSRQPASADVQFVGVVQEVTFVGSDHKIDIVVGSTILSARSINSGEPPPERGQTVYLSCNSGDITSLRD